MYSCNHQSLPLSPNNRVGGFFLSLWHPHNILNGLCVCPHLRLRCKFSGQVLKSIIFGKDTGSCILISNPPNQCQLNRVIPKTNLFQGKSQIGWPDPYMHICNIHLKYALFRCILIVYSHRGLVLNGYPNLKLFISIHWIYFATMIAYDFGVYPLSHMLKADFPQNSIKGQICMKQEFKLGEMNIKQRFFGFIGPLLLFVFMFRMWKYSTDYLKGQNLNMKTFFPN